MKDQKLFLVKRQPAIAFCFLPCYNIKANVEGSAIALYLGVAQMVARYLGVVEAVGSNPATRTMRSVLIGHSALFLLKTIVKKVPGRMSSLVFVLENGVLCLFL